MATLPLEDLVDDGDNLSPVEHDGEEFRCDLFQRAYCGEGGPFERVLRRLRAGFSVLVYLPGNCMSAAAGKAREQWPGAVEYGHAPQDSANITKVWLETADLFGRLTAWLDRTGTRPNAIYHNLDLLTSGPGALDPMSEAKTALFSLISTARRGAVLGLADREAGPLPPPLRRPFSEEVELREIPVSAFHRVMPRSLGRRIAHALGTGGGLPAGAVRLLASRLRWSDPVRAYKIMRAVGGAESFKAVLDGVLEHTVTIEFERPSAQGASLPGVPPKDLELLEGSVIAPYRAWSSLDQGDDRWETALRRLPPGIILYGPPGTGKTRLARWIAARVGLPMRIVTAADIKQSYWGDAERRVHDVFSSARRSAPCVLVFDDADDLLQDRATVTGAVAGGERGIVNAFLQAVDGMQGLLEGVLIVLTTNRYAALDGAARDRIRPFHIRVPYPVTRAQLAEVVDRVAEDYGYTLAGAEKEALLDRFWRTVRRDPLARIDDEDWRFAAEANLFAPREIREAMRLLLGGTRAAGQPYAVKPDDVLRMTSYYARFVRDDFGRAE